ncbi:MAG: fibrobacter succinogenes major paralogous domain-containing protein [bacterium]
MKIGNYISKQGQLIFIALLFIGFTGKVSMAQMTDKDGNTYKTVKIGNQEWMAENLNVSYYRNGDPIPQVQDANEWSNLSTGAWCYYENNTESGKTYGKLYNWYAVNDPRGLAPEGWHIPTDREWAILTDRLGGESVAGGKMKESGRSHWLRTNANATNESGFSALPDGCRLGKFLVMGILGHWWSTMEYNTTDGCTRYMSCDDDGVFRGNLNKKSGLSVRCVKGRPVKYFSLTQMTDKDGNTYKTVKIGKQEWMAENLNVSYYRNGDPIPQVQDAEEWTNLNTGAWCYYENNAENGKTYGKLYNWYAVNDPRGLAPEGWHIPTHNEWTILTDCLRGRYVAGGEMKEAGTTHWKSPNGEATNESGFSALPGGGRGTFRGVFYDGGAFSDMGICGYWWSTTEDSYGVGALTLHIRYFNAYVDSYGCYETFGFSVRCVRD